MKTCNECGVVVEVAVCGRNVTLCPSCLRKFNGEPPFWVNDYTSPTYWYPDNPPPLRYMSGGGTQV